VYTSYDGLDYGAYPIPRTVIVLIGGLK